MSGALSKIKSLFKSKLKDEDDFPARDFYPDYPKDVSNSALALRLLHRLCAEPFTEHEKRPIGRSILVRYDARPLSQVVYGQRKVQGGGK